MVPPSPAAAVAASPPGQLVADLLTALLHDDSPSASLIASLLIGALVLSAAIVALVLSQCCRPQRSTSSVTPVPAAVKDTITEPVRVCRAAVISAEASECGALLPSHMPRSDMPTGLTGTQHAATVHASAAPAPTAARSDFAAENTKAVTIASDVEEGARGGGWGDLGGFDGIARDEHPTTRRPERQYKGEAEEYVAAGPPMARRGPPANAPAAASRGRRGAQEAGGRRGRR